jgi:hypothetical protein
MEEILKQIEVIEAMSLDTRTECFMQLQQVNKLKILLQQQVKNLNIHDVRESCIQFAIWVQDNYSQNKKANTYDMLPKGQMRKDFTNDIYTMNEIWGHYNSR